MIPLIDRWVMHLEICPSKNCRLEEICRKLLDKNFFGPIDMVYPVIKIMKINPILEPFDYELQD